MSPDILHKHLIVRAEVRNPLTKEKDVDEWMKKLVELLKMKILMGPFSKYCHKLGNEGVTGIVAIETSHISLHIWDRCEPPIVQLDVYTCSDLDENIVFNHLSNMNPEKIEWKYIDRLYGLKLLSNGKIIK